MPRIGQRPTAKVTLFSCHASHEKDPDKTTSGLFRNLVKKVKQVREDHVDEIVSEMFNRTILLNLTPAGDLQYDDPTVPTIEEITGLRVFWTFAYDPPYAPNALKTRLQSARNKETTKHLSELQHAITYAILHTMEEYASQGLQVLYTTASDPTPEPSTPIYSLIELPNPNIYSSTVFDARVVFQQQFHGDLLSFIQYLCSFNNHTRYYIAAKSDTPDLLQLMTNVYKSLYKKLQEIDHTVVSLREYSNALAYFSPNAKEVARSLIPLLQTIRPNVDLATIHHPYLEHSVLMTGYALMCGPDMLLEKGHGDIQTYRKVSEYNMRFATASIPTQMFQHFVGWIQNIHWGQEFPPIAPYIAVVHACNRCDTEGMDGTCACYLDMTPYVQRKGITYRGDPKTQKIVYEEALSM